MLDLRVNSLPLSLCGPLYTAREAHEAPLGLGLGWLHSITAWRQCEGPRLLGLCINPHTEKTGTSDHGCLAAFRSLRRKCCLENRGFTQASTHPSSAGWDVASTAVFRFHLFIVLDAWNFLKNFNFQGTAFASADQSIAQRQQRHWARRALQPGGTSRLQHSVLQLSVSEGKQRSGGRKWGGHE